MNWPHKVLDALLNRGQIGVPESTRTELVREKRKRRVEHERTNELARIIADYRAQDGALRR